MSDLFSYQSRNPTHIVPERIREAREARGYTSEEFAELLGVTRQALAQYEGGQTMPRPEIMSKIIGETAQPTTFFTTSKRHASPNRPLPQAFRAILENHVALRMHRKHPCLYGLFFLTR